MNFRLLTFIVTAMVSISTLSYAKSNKKCTKPDEVVLELTMQSCAHKMSEMSKVALYNWLCKSLGREPLCTFTPDDQPVVEQIIIGRARSCIRDQFKIEHFCTDGLGK